jgi:hypothetical protein
VREGWDARDERKRHWNCGRSFRADRLVEDALDEVGGGFGPGALEEFKPCRAALRLGEGLAAPGAGAQVLIEKELVGGREKVVECVGKELFAGDAVGVVTRAVIVELDVLCHV